MAANIDRAKVLRFFTWTNRELGPLFIAIGCMIAASWISYLGVAVAVRNAEKDWVLLYTSAASAAFLAIAILAVRRALRGDKPLLEFHDEVKRAKNFDFANLILRSFRKAETSLNSLLDFGQVGPAASSSTTGSTEDEALLEALQPKAVLLSGRHEGAEFLKFLFDGHALIVEYSPVAVAVLYLTRTELIVYLASAGIVRGDLGAEEIRRIPLENVGAVTLEPASRRIRRAGNERLFHEYERVIRNNPTHEILAMERSIRVANADGEDLILPAGDPVYRGSSRQLPDAWEGDRISRAARQVSRRIAEAKAAAEGEARPEPKRQQS
jgi:hypothetical protein